MAEGHRVLPVRVCVCVPESCLTHILSCIVGFENNLAQMIIMTRQCVACKNQVDRSKVKVTVHT